MFHTEYFWLSLMTSMICRETGYDSHDVNVWHSNAYTTSFPRRETCLLARIHNKPLWLSLIFYIASGYGGLDNIPSNVCLSESLSWCRSYSNLVSESHVFFLLQAAHYVLHDRAPIWFFSFPCDWIWLGNVKHCRRRSPWMHCWTPQDGDRVSPFTVCTTVTLCWLFCEDRPHPHLVALGSISMFIDICCTFGLTCRVWWMCQIICRKSMQCIVDGQRSQWRLDGHILDHFVVTICLI